MTDTKELFFSKFNICTNFELDLDSDTIHELENVDDALIKANSSVYIRAQEAVNNLVRPFVFYLGIKNISALDHDRIRIYADLRKRIEKFGLNFYLLEPLSTYVSTKTEDVWYCEYRKEDIPVIRSLELDSIANFCKRCDLKSARVYSNEHNVKTIFAKKYRTLLLNTKILFWPFGVSGIDDSFDSNLITKKFWSGNKRYSVHRHIVAAYLISKVPKEMLNISWFCESNIKDLVDRFDADAMEEKKQSIIDGVYKLDSKAPMTFDVDIKSKMSIHNNFHIEFNQQNTNYSYAQSFCAVVTETRFFQFSSVISEKIINAILNKKFFILVAPPKTLCYLKSFGVKTFDRWIDESYDQEQDHIRRLHKILDLIDYINGKDIEELQAIYNEMQPVVMHNLRRLIKFQEYWQDQKLQTLVF